MSRALRVNTAAQVMVSFHLLRRGAAKRGWCCAAPSLFAAWSAVPIYLACLTVGFSNNRRAAILHNAVRDHCSVFLPPQCRYEISYHVSVA